MNEGTRLVTSGYRPANTVNLYIVNLKILLPSGPQPSRHYLQVRFLKPVHCPKSQSAHL